MGFKKRKIHHVTKSDYRRADTIVCPRNGFIHCCTSKQLPGVLERYYSHVSEVTLLTLRTSLPYVWENTSGGTELFPHLYSNIETKDVTGYEVLHLSFGQCPSKDQLFTKS